MASEVAADRRDASAANYIACRPSSTAASLVNSPAGFAIFTKAIASKQAIDATTFRITTNGPYPLLLSDLGTIFILSRKAAEGVPTEDFAKGRRMTGTGAYKFVSFQRDDRVELTRNDAAWGDKPAWDKVTIRIIPNNASRLASLLSNDVDGIEGVEAPLWSEKVRTFHEVEHLCFPRLLCLAEVGWTPQPMRQWDDFRLRLQHETNRLAMEGVSVHRSKLL